MQAPAQTTAMRHVGVVIVAMAAAAAAAEARAYHLEPIHRRPQPHYPPIPPRQQQQQVSMVQAWCQAPFHLPSLTSTLTLKVAPAAFNSAAIVIATATAA